MSEWRPVVGYEGFYEVSSDGAVRSLHRGGRILKQSWDPKKKRLHLTLARDGHRRYRPVHRLVIEAFIGPPPGPGMHACHNDGDGRNNRVENLRWDSPSGNQLDCVKHGNHPFASRTHCSAGHEYTPGNTRIVKGGVNKGHRICRTCYRDSQARHREKHRDAISRRNKVWRERLASGEITLPPLDREICARGGSESQAKAHRRRGEKPCDNCRKAESSAVVSRARARREKAA